MTTYHQLEFLHPDPQFFYLEGEGSDGSTTILDSSCYNRSCVAAGNAQIRTGVSGALGSGVIDLDASAGTWVTIPEPPWLAITNGYDFAIQVRVKFKTAAGTFQTLLALRQTSNAWTLYRESGGEIALFNSNPTIVITGTTVLSLSGPWYEIWWMRIDGVHRLYVDGVAEGATYNQTGTIGGVGDTAGAIQDVRIGGNFAGNNRANVYIERIRMLSGRAIPLT